ncbi:MAG: C1 family peptidase [Pirellulaceae bacterium]
MHAKILATCVALLTCFVAQWSSVPSCSGQELTPLPRAEYEKIPTRDDRPNIDSVVEPELIILESQEPEPKLDLKQTTEMMDAQPIRTQAFQSMAPTFPQTFNGFQRDMKLPSKVDSLQDYLPTPGKQNEKNDCVAWSVAYATYSCQICQERRRKNPTLNSDIFSPEFIYKELGKENKPLYVVDVINHVARNGCATLATMASPSPDDEIAEAKNFKPLRNERARSLNEIKAYLYEGYPVVLMIKIDDQFRDPKDDYCDLKDSAQPYQWSGKQQGKRPSYHAITAVGYDDDRGPAGAVQIMNSWGTNWKCKGFCWVSYKNFDDIDDNHWCSEAHIVGIKRIAPINVYMNVISTGSTRPRERLFQLRADRKVYDHQNNRVSPDDWKIDDVACTTDTMFVLKRDQTVYKLNDSGGQRSWTHLNSGLMAGEKATMLAADDTTEMHALTSSHKLLRFDTNSGSWSRAALPSDAGDIVDLRIRSRRLVATNIDGHLFERNRRSEWKAVR